MLYAAVGLAERIACGLPADHGDGERAVRRLRRWASQPPFDEPSWWGRRLAADGLTDGVLHRLLAEPAPALAGRLPDRPDWLTELEAAYRSSSSDGSGFAALAMPLLSRARERLADRLAALGPAPFDPDELLAWLHQPLARSVEQMLTRTMVLELNVARLRGTLPGDSPEARFDAFCAGLRRPAERRRLIGTYPVVGRLLATVASNWVESSALFASRLVADWPLLGHRDRVSGVVTGMGDPHRGGQTVTAVSCGEARIVYKPRPVSPDVHVAALFDWLAARGISLRVPSCLDRGEYGWVEFVAAKPCADGEELRRFYRRHGALLAVLYLLRANDLSSDNLIASGEHPVLVDLEAICQPELRITVDGAPAAEQAALAAASASVLRVGLLPSQSWTTSTGGSVDVSALGDAPGQLNPIALPEPADAGTDRMRLELRRGPLAPASNRPGPSLRVSDYVDDVVEGFAETYELCRLHRRELLAGPLAAFAGDQVRVIVRPTAEYALLRDTGHHPDMLRDGLDCERHFDRLWRGVSRRPALAACVESERHDLWRQDIPMFTARTDELVLRSSTGAPVPGLVRRTGMDAVRQVVDRLSAADLDRQTWLIRTSLVTSTIDGQEPSRLYPLPPGRPTDPDRLIAGADAIGRHLASVAYRAPDSADWLGVVSSRGERWSLGALGPDLYTGLTGLALFFGYLGELSGDEAHTCLARAALATARSQVERRALARVGGSAGLGGIIYAFTRLGCLWYDEELVDAAVSLAVLNGQWAVDDEQFDFTSGSAGSVAALRALHVVRPVAPVRDAIRACADRLVAGQIPAGPGAAWLPVSMREEGIADVPLSGFAHGAAGIAWPLLEAASLCCDSRYHDAALLALAYERSLFVPDAGTWRDVRRTAGGAVFDFSGWCHGAAGIGLSRVLSLPHVSDDLVRTEIAAAVRHTRQVGFGTNHSLCHGDLGNLELLVAAAEALHEPSWREEASVLTGAVLDSIDDRGWISGLPRGVETPGLLHGLAGIGYGMLRMAAPHRVPSVLVLG